MKTPDIKIEKKTLLLCLFHTKTVVYSPKLTTYKDEQL